MRRKLFDYTVGLIAGILLAYYLDHRLTLICCLLGSGYLAKQLRNHKQSNLSTKAIISGFCVFGMALFLLTQLGYTYGPLHEQSLKKESAEITGRVVSIECQEEDVYRLTIQLQHERVLCSYYAQMDEPWAVLGYMISFSGEIQVPSASGNPRCFDYQLYLRTCGIGYISTIENIQVVDTHRGLWYMTKAFILAQRDSYLEQMSGSDLAKGILRGILFGDTNQMDEDVYEDFRQNGTAHVLAVSGLHVGILYSVYRKIYQKIHHPLCTLLFLMLLFVYGTATLWSVSVTRAMVLICLVIVGNMLHRRYDLLTALAAVAILVIIRNPYVIFDAGFQMSFLAVVSIVFLQPAAERLIGTRMAVSASVQAGLLPYMAYVFNYVSFVGIICNIPVIYLTSLVVPLGIASFMIFFLFHQSIPLLDVVVTGMSEMLVKVNGLFSADGWLSFDVVSPPLWSIALTYGIMFFAASEQAQVYFGRKEWKSLLKPTSAIALTVVLAVPFGGSSFDQADLVFVDVGQGDCIHIKDSAGRSTLVDGGGNINYDVGKKVLKPYLLKNGFHQIELAAATHQHTDHYLGLQQLADCFDVRAQLITGKAGDVIRLSETEWMEILWPLEENPETEDENLNSLIFMIYQEGIKTLITGDITAEGEKMLLEEYGETGRLAADILKIAHHGSAYSTSDAFLSEVNPRVAVICVGRNNYGHPSDIVIEKLEKKGIMVFRTDLDGAVGIMIRKGTISVCTEKQR